MNLNFFHVSLISTSFASALYIHKIHKYITESNPENNPKSQSETKKHALQKQKIQNHTKNQNRKKLNMYS